MRHIIFLINPISGTGSKLTLTEQVTAHATAAGYPFRIFPSQKDGNYAHLHTYIKEKAVTDVVIAGGDGTINAAINSLRSTGVQFGILPCGSGNGLAFSAGIPKNIEKALQIIDAGNSQLTDAFLLNNHFACMLCGLGFDAQVAHDFANDPARGLTTYIKKTVQNFFTAKAYPFQLTLKDSCLEVEAYFMSIANSNQFGNHFTIAPKASLTDGLLDIVIATRQNKLALLLQTVRQVAGFNQVQQVEVLDKKAGVIYFQTSGLHITNKELAPLHLDGDPVPTATAFNVQMLKEAFRLIYP